MMMMRASRGVDAALSSGVACPKPRRVGGFFNSPSGFDAVQSIKPSCYLQFGHQMEACDSESGTELLDIILTKGGCSYGEGRANFQTDSSLSPFFSGTPPSRSSNPLIQDTQFGHDIFDPITPTLEAIAPPPPSSPPPPPLPSSARKNGGGGCGMKFGNKPAPVRIEGFNCGRSCSISAVA
ncbi:unnamed protein product [Cuscuta epithymum]|uniref:Uncharacterized protein n=1 Tax=Cuscuta epithymum TaxID=186058 RepID=A0AAV0CSR8_9ASTE|nr:unnamed protein product [Cuscuta epithymum]